MNGREGRGVLVITDYISPRPRDVLHGAFSESRFLWLQISGRRMSTSDSGVEMSVSPHARTLPTPHVVGSYPVQQTPRHPAAYPDDDPNLYRGELDGLMRQHPQNYQRQRSTYQVREPIIPNRFFKIMEVNSYICNYIKFGELILPRSTRSLQI